MSGNTSSSGNDPATKKWTVRYQLHDIVIDKAAQANGHVYLAVTSNQIYKGDANGKWNYLTYDLQKDDREIIFDFGVQGDLIFLMNNTNGDHSKIRDILYYSTDGGLTRKRVVLPTWVERACLEGY